MLTNFWSLSLLSVFLWQKTSSSVIIVFLRPVFKDVNSWFCFVISFCKYVMATNKLDMMLVSLFSSLFSSFLSNSSMSSDSISLNRSNYFSSLNRGRSRTAFSVFIWLLLSCVALASTVLQPPSRRKQTKDCASRHLFFQTLLLSSTGSLWMRMPSIGRGLGFLTYIFSGLWETPPLLSISAGASLCGW